MITMVAVTALEVPVPITATLPPGFTSAKVPELVPSLYVVEEVTVTVTVEPDEVFSVKVCADESTVPTVPTGLCEVPDASPTRGVAEGPASALLATPGRTVAAAAPPATIRTAAIPLAAAAAATGAMRRRPCQRSLEGPPECVSLLMIASPATVSVPARYAPASVVPHGSRRTSAFSVAQLRTSWQS
jgi:hypothetical protein